MRKYIGIFHLSFTQCLFNYKALIGLGIFLITTLIIFSHLWKVIAARMGLSFLDPQQLLWYIAFNEWVLVSIPDIEENMEQDLLSGRLSYLLPRPISYLGATFAEAFGALVVNLLFLGALTFSFTYMQAGPPSFSWHAWIPIGFSGLLAGIVAVLFRMAIGLSSFWLTEVGPFYWLWEKLLFMLGGLMLPLTAYPQWIQWIAKFTPFPAILSMRSSCALDCSFSILLTIFSSLMGWGLFALLLLIFLYRKGLRILHIEGG